MGNLRSAHRSARGRSADPIDSEPENARAAQLDQDARAILLVEPDPEEQVRMARQLSGLGHRVVGTGSSDGALALVSEWQVDLVLVAQQLPRTTGLDAASSIASIANGVPVLVTVDEEDFDPASDGEPSYSSEGLREALRKVRANPGRSGDSGRESAHADPARTESRLLADSLPGPRAKTGSGSDATPRRLLFGCIPRSLPVAELEHWLGMSRELAQVSRSQAQHDGQPVTASSSDAPAPGNPDRDGIGQSAAEHDGRLVTPGPVAPFEHGTVYDSTIRPRASYGARTPSSPRAPGTLRRRPPRHPREEDPRHGDARTGGRSENGRGGNHGPGTKGRADHTSGDKPDGDAEPIPAE